MPTVANPPVLLLPNSAAKPMRVGLSPKTATNYSLSFMFVSQGAYSNLGAVLVC